MRRLRNGRPRPFVPKRSVGRPAKDAADKQGQRMTFLVTEDQRAAILARVPPGRDFSDWAREKLLS
jgi:hypothetical protein